MSSVGPRHRLGAENQREDPQHRELDPSDLVLRPGSEDTKQPIIGPTGIA